jgi:hypothetical protein
VSRSTARGEIIVAVADQDIMALAQAVDRVQIQLDGKEIKRLFTYRELNIVAK